MRRARRQMGCWIDESAPQVVRQSVLRERVKCDRETSNHRHPCTHSSDVRGDPISWATAQVVSQRKSHSDTHTRLRRNIHSICGHVVRVPGSPFTQHVFCMSCSDEDGGFQRRVVSIRRGAACFRCFGEVQGAVVTCLVALRWCVDVLRVCLRSSTRCAPHARVPMRLFDQTSFVKQCRIDSRDEWAQSTCYRGHSSTWHGWMSPNLEILGVMVWTSPAAWYMLCSTCECFSVRAHSCSGPRIANFSEHKAVERGTLLVVSSSAVARQRVVDASALKKLEYVHSLCKTIFPPSATDISRSNASCTSVALSVS